jgi:hypothetical protein
MVQEYLWGVIDAVPTVVVVVVVGGKRKKGGGGKVHHHLLLFHHKEDGRSVIRWGPITQSWLRP